MVEHTQKQNNEDATTTEIDNQADNEPTEIELTDAEEQVAAKIKTLRDKLAACQEQRRQAEEDAQRHRAEFLNTRKRLESDVVTQITRTKQSFIASILPLCDSFTMAMANRDAWEAVDATWRKGVEGIHAQLQSVLVQYKVVAHTPVGESFDPTRHEAVGEASVSDVSEQGLIQTVVQPGYTMTDEQEKEILIRPARVIVGVAEETMNTENSEDSN